jgi:transcription antitermination factor NusG
MTDQLKPGDQIEVTDGDFANFRGELESVDGNIANIRIPVFGRVHGPI